MHKTSIWIGYGKQIFKCVHCGLFYEPAILSLIGLNNNVYCFLDTKLNNSKLQKFEMSEKVKYQLKDESDCSSSYSEHF